MAEPRWMLNTTKGDSLESAFPHLPRIVRTILEQRGKDSPEEVEAFLNPRLKELSDPFSLHGMSSAVDRLFRAIDQKEHVVLFGDYDVDGISSLALLSEALERYGLERCSCFIPLRSAEGYGLNEVALDRCFEENGQIDLLVTLDCGTSSIKEIESLKIRGVDVVVIDHHELSESCKPDCVALVNPKANQVQEQIDLSYLCAAGVTFKVIHALLKSRPIHDYDLKESLDIVALATVADIVPLIGENRVLVRHGLRNLSTTNRLGLIALKEIAAVNGVLEAADVGFRIAPRINAAGRMDAPMEALELLRTTHEDNASFLVKRLDRYNQQRQAYEKRILLEAEECISREVDLDQSHAIVIGKREWHPGVVGIVASRIMRRYFKPAFVIAVDKEGVGKGSGRSLNDLSLVNGIKACERILLAGGGHHLAAGISVKEQNIPEFRKTLCHYYESTTTSEQREARIVIDAEVEFEELDFTFLQSYEQLKPFGSKNRQPVFMSRRVTNAKPVKHLKNDHLKLVLRQNGCDHEAIFFGGGASELPTEPWDVAYTVDKNCFRGRVTLQLTVQHVRPSTAQF